MKKKFIILLILSFFVFLIKPVKATETASGSINTSISSSSVVLGNQITLRININCSTGIGGGKLIISYDSSYLTLSNYDLAGKGSISNNIILIEPSESTSISYTLTFTAIKIGNANITVNTFQFIDYNNGYYVSDYADSITKSLEIIAKTNNNPDKPTITLSSDATLYSLKISNLELDEPFSGDKYTYTAYAEDKITQLDIEAVCNSSKASYKVEGNNLKEGWNEITIICTAEDGKTKEYKINVYVEETPTVFYDEKYGVVKNLDKVSVPEDFEKKEEVIENNKLTLFEHGNLYLIYLKNENDQKDFYVLNKEINQIICKYEPISIDNKKYLAINFDYEQINTLSEKFEPTKYRIDENTVLNCWKYKASNMTNYRIFYLMDENGNKNIYSYETTEKTMQKFIEPIEMIDTNNNDEQIINIIYMSCAIAGGLCLIISLVIISKNQNDFK